MCEYDLVRAKNRNQSPTVCFHHIYGHGSALLCFVVGWCSLRLYASTIYTVTVRLCCVLLWVGAVSHCMLPPYIRSRLGSAVFCCGLVQSPTVCFHHIYGHGSALLCFVVGWCSLPLYASTIYTVTVRLCCVLLWVGAVSDCMLPPYIRSRLGSAVFCCGLVQSPTVCFHHIYGHGSALLCFVVGWCSLPLYASTIYTVTVRLCCVLLWVGAVFHCMFPPYIRSRFGSAVFCCGLVQSPTACFHHIYGHGSALLCFVVGWCSLPLYASTIYTVTVRLCCVLLWVGAVFRCMLPPYIRSRVGSVVFCCGLVRVTLQGYFTDIRQPQCQTLRIPKNGSIESPQN